ncbi:MAG: sigma-70 family RNA polymerase sigma factor [bacterium]
MTNLSDVQLIEAARNGSQEAVSVLYERHLPCLLAQSRTYAGADLEPHDLVHEAWIRILGDLHRFTPRKSFRSWAVTVLRNLGRDAATRRSRRKELLFQHRLDLNGPPHDDREKHVQTARERKVRQLMEPLTARQRLALLLHVGQRASSGEVSRAMGCSPPTVRTTCFFALERVRVEMGRARPREAG